LAELHSKRQKGCQTGSQRHAETEREADKDEGTKTNIDSER